jgi:hypothetical protein
MREERKVCCPTIRLEIFWIYGKGMVLNEEEMKVLSLLP